MKIIKNPEVAAVYSLNFILNYYDNHPSANDEEILKELHDALESADINGELRIIGIASANKVLAIKRKNKRTSNKQIIQNFISEFPSFLQTIQLEEENN